MFFVFKFYFDQDVPTQNIRKDSLDSGDVFWLLESHFSNLVDSDDLDFGLSDLIDNDLIA